MTETPRDVLNRRPQAIIVGRIGVGKTYETARAFWRYRWLTTNPTALAPYAQQLENGSLTEPEYGWPRIKTIQEFDALGDNRIITEAWFRGWIRKWAQGALDGSNPYPGLVIDEASTLFEWIMRDIKRNATGVRYGEIDKIKEIAAWLGQVFRNINRGLVLVMHTRPKQHVGEREEERGAPNFGAVKYDAQPAFPIGTMGKLVCREYDIVWEVSNDADDDSPEDGVGDRYFLTEPGQHVLRKGRRFGIAPKELITLDDGLREKLLRVGFQLE